VQSAGGVRERGCEVLRREGERERGWKWRHLRDDPVHLLHCDLGGVFLFLFRSESSQLNSAEQRSLP